MPYVMLTFEWGNATIKESFFRTWTGSFRKGANFSQLLPPQSMATFNPTWSTASTHSLADPSKTGTCVSMSNKKLMTIPVHALYSIAGAFLSIHKNRLILYLNKWKLLTYEYSQFFESLWVSIELFIINVFYKMWKLSKIWLIESLFEIDVLKIIFNHIFYNNLTFSTFNHAFSKKFISPYKKSLLTKLLFKFTISILH